MALPFSINTTYAAGSQVKSADLNAMQASIVAEHNRPMHYAASAFQLWGGHANTVLGYAGQWRTTAAAGDKIASLDISKALIAGDVIKEITWRWRNGVTPAAGSVVFSLTRAPVATPWTETQLYASVGQDTSTGGASALRTLLAAINHVVLADNFYVLTLEMDTTAGNDEAGFAGATVVLGA